MAESTKKKEKPPILRLISMLLNPFFWNGVWLRLKHWLFPSKNQTIKLFGPALDAKLIGLDGFTSYSLLRDYVEKTPDIPLVINIGSYN